MNGTWVWLKLIDGQIPLEIVCWAAAIWWLRFGGCDLVVAIWWL